MVRQYTEDLYRPASAAEAAVSAEDYAGGRALAAWRARVSAAWPSVAVAHVESGGMAAVPHVGDDLHLRAHIDLDGLTPQDVTVEVVHGRAGEDDTMTQTRAVALEPASAQSPGKPTLFVGTLQLTRAGGFGYTVRVLPRNPLLASSADLGLIATAG
jgi:starch phosphorylase